MVNGWKMRTLPGSVGIMAQDGKIGLENGCVKMLLPGVRIHTGAVTVMEVTWETIDTTELINVMSVIPGRMKQHVVLMKDVDQVGVR